MTPILALRHRPAWIIGFLALVALCISLGVVIVTYRPAGAGGNGSTALSYARKHIVWLQGPRVRSTHTIPLRRLQPLLARTVSSTLRNDVNVPDLERRYGPDRKVAVVILNGVYNSLPPDEGIDIRGDMVVLVDVRTNRVLFLTD